MPQYNNSIESAVRVLSLFTSAHPRWGTSEVSRALGISKTTTYNLLITLEKTGLLQKNEDSPKYELGQKLGSLGAIMAANHRLGQKASGIAQELSSILGISARLGIWDTDAILIIYSCAPVNAPQQPSYQAGPRIVAYSTAVGRAILAYRKTEEVENYLNHANLVKYTAKTRVKKSEILKELDETKKRGYSICDEEMVFGGAAIAAPIFDRNNHVAGALSITGKKEQILGSNMNSLIGGLSSKTMQISQSIGYGAQ